MNEHAGMSLGRPLDRDSDNDPRAAPSRAERQAEQEIALQRWETEGGAVGAPSRQQDDQTDREAN
jgi:hypothetical protein